jgi:hypothetical protein
MVSVWGRGAGVGVLLLAACVRPAIPAGGSGPGRPTVTETWVLERRPVPGGWDGGARPDLTCGFLGDTVVVTGEGWDPDTAEVEVSGVTLDRVTARAQGELRATITWCFPEGPVAVVSHGKRSQPSAARLCCLGPGHPVSPTFRGVTEPSITINAASVAGAPCSPWERGAAAQEAAGHCGDLARLAEVVGVSFTLGPTQTFKDPVFVSRLHPMLGLSEMAELPRRDGGADWARLVNAAVPYGTLAELWGAEEDGGVRPVTAYPHVATVEGVILDSDGGLAMRVWLGDRLRATSTVQADGGPTAPGTWGRLVPPLARHRDHWLAMEGRVGTQGEVGYVLHWLPHNGTGQGDATWARPRSIPVATGVIPSSRIQGLLGAGLPPGVIHVTVARAVAPDASPSLEVNLVAFPDGEQPPRALCDETTGCDQGGAQVPWLTLTARNCLGRPDCLACVRELSSRLPVDQASLLEVASLDPDTVVFLPGRPPTPQYTERSAVCGLSRAPQGVGLFGMSPGQLSVSAGTVLPPGEPAWQPQPDGGWLAVEDPALLVVPVRGATAPEPELWRIGLASGMQVLPARQAYASLLAEPGGTRLFAFPATGGRVDVLNLEGRLLRSVSVLGTPGDVLPLSGQDAPILAVYPHLVVRMDAAGRVTHHRSGDFSMPVLWTSHGGNSAEQVWVARLGGAQGASALSVARVDLRSGPAFGDAQEWPTGVEALWARPVATRERDGAVTSVILLVVQAAADFLGLSCPAGESHAQPSHVFWLAEVDVTGAGGQVPRVLNCNAMDAVADVEAGLVYVLDILSPPAPADGGVPDTSTDTNVVTVVLDLTGTDTRARVVSGSRIPVAIVPEPGVGMVGVFFSEASFEYELGRWLHPAHCPDFGDEGTPELCFEHWGPAPFAEGSLVLSPDGTRLYVGVQDAITVQELRRPADGGPLTPGRASQVAVRGKPTRMVMDPAGARLMYVSREDQVVGLVE